MVLHAGGEPCPCGRRGCWERYASASALTRETKAAMQADKNTIMWKMTQDIDHVNAKLAFDAAAKGDETARKVIDSWIEYVGVGIANVINTVRAGGHLHRRAVCPTRARSCWTPRPRLCGERDPEHHHRQVPGHLRLPAAQRCRCDRRCRTGQFYLIKR